MLTLSHPCTQITGLSSNSSSILVMLQGKKQTPSLLLSTVVKGKGNEKCLRSQREQRKKKCRVSPKIRAFWGCKTQALVQKRILLHSPN